MRIKQYLSTHLGSRIISLMAVLVVIFAVFMCGVVAAVEQATNSQPLEVVQNNAPRMDKMGFVNNQTCAECHAEQFKDWRGSHHGLAMQKANKQTIPGDFDNVSYTATGVTSRIAGSPFLIAQSKLISCLVIN